MIQILVKKWHDFEAMLKNKMYEETGQTFREKQKAWHLVSYEMTCFDEKGNLHSQAAFCT